MKDMRDNCYECPLLHQIIVDEDFETILICAVRYSLGRRTYMPGLVINYITPLLRRLSIKTLKVMEKDVGDTDDVGDTIIDAPGWIRFLADIRAALAERSKE